MLVLNRKQGEKIVIGDNIYVTILETRNGNVTIGVDAPKDISVHREEIYDKINNRHCEDCE